METEIKTTKNILGESLKSGFSNDDILNTSQDLDKLIVKCLRCKISPKSLDYYDINYVHGSHSMFLYYDVNHLMFNLARYIKHANLNNEKTFLFIQPDWFEYIKTLNISTENVTYFPVNEVIQLYKKKGASELRNTIVSITEDSLKAGFNGVRMIGQPSYAIKLTNEEDFLSFESVLTKTFEKLPASGLCLYDFFDYTNGGKFITEKVIKSSFDSHQSIANF